MSFDSTVMIGRQSLDASASEFRAIFGAIDLPQPGYAEPLFQALGARTVDSLDVNDYERATILHDMNTPVPPSLRERFSLVVDGGALEHIFNFPVAIQNCMNMVAVGGHFIAGVPANNLTGHGFYQFSPELYYRVFSSRYGFDVEAMFLATRFGRGKWYRVTDPAFAKRRVLFSNWLETNLYVVARKTASLSMTTSPQQSDYEMLEWRGDAPSRPPPRQDPIAMARRAIMRSLPEGLADYIRNQRELYRFFWSQFAAMPGLERVAIESLPR